ncbi:uncharacterized protein METZ01_LOCUS104565 [marine metagenome]|uniref:PEGA domain-containing protein n=1 Tax=marine metagenome TaxID=408172 RepID=A0A381WHE2_9ZZZZ
MIISPNNFQKGIITISLLLSTLFGQSYPTIEYLSVDVRESGFTFEFLLSDSISRNDVSSWIERDNWLMLNFYNVEIPAMGFFDQNISYPIQKIHQAGTNHTLKLSFNVAHKLGIVDVILHDGKKVTVVIRYTDAVAPKEVNPSFIFPNPKDARKIQHPLSWKDDRERTILVILCDTDGLPIYIDDQMVGYSPLENGIDILPGWHKVGYFPKKQNLNNEVRTPKERMINDIMRMGLLDVYIEEGKSETIVLNYQSLDDEVLDYNRRSQTGIWAGFGIFFLVIVLMSWGLA